MFCYTMQGSKCLTAALEAEKKRKIENNVESLQNFTTNFIRKHTTERWFSVSYRRKSEKYERFSSNIPFIALQ